jgi:Xaa-Pro aminopeptidase
MVFTIEPKLYVTEHGFGIMIEDEILVTETGAEVLSLHAPRTADAIEAMMREEEKH